MHGLALNIPITGSPGTHIMEIKSDDHDYTLTVEQLKNGNFSFTFTHYHPAYGHSHIVFKPTFEQLFYLKQELEKP